MSKKYWALWAVINLIMGAGGFVLLAIGFLFGVAWSANAANQSVLYITLAVAGFLLLWMICLANRIMVGILSQYSEKPIPPAVEPAGNLLAWAVVIVIYLFMSFCA